LRELAAVFIISIAQHARPNVAGQMLLFRAQLIMASRFTVTTSGTADRVLGTFPKAEDVPSSPTAKNLHAGG
jgi:hypothetical protein